jgi:hypothetical protein
MLKMPTDKQNNENVHHLKEIPLENRRITTCEVGNMLGISFE